MSRSFALVVLAVVACDKSPKSETDRPTGAASAGGVDGEGAADHADAGEDAADDQGMLTSSPDADRSPMIASDHPLYGRLEGDGFPNACEDDDRCYKSGCSAEVCSAEQDVVTTCDVLPVEFPPDAACGCVDGQCQWWSPTHASLGGSAPATEPPRFHEGTPPASTLTPCGDKTCKPGQECMTYYGVAGSSGPEFKSCEWRCKPGSKDTTCPAGTRCVTIADGPGSICR
jgi:eight-cysteine-cluster-containing protein